MRRRIVLSGLAFAAAFVLVSCQSEPEMKTHLTIYVSPQLAQSGGLVIVSGVAVPPTDWDALPQSNGVAMLDPANPKAGQVELTDKHFGVVISEAVTRVEFVYPEEGSYTFNFLVEPTTGPAPALQTTLIAEGTSTTNDLDTGERVTRDSESVIAILGPDRPEAWARQAEVWFYSEATFENRAALVLRVFEGARTVALHADRIAELQQVTAP